MDCTDSLTGLMRLLAGRGGGPSEEREDPDVRGYLYRQEVALSLSEWVHDKRFVQPRIYVPSHRLLLEEYEGEMIATEEPTKELIACMTRSAVPVRVPRGWVRDALAKIRARKDFDRHAAAFRGLVGEHDDADEDLRRGRREARTNARASVPSFPRT